MDPQTPTTPPVPTDDEQVNQPVPTEQPNLGGEGAYGEGTPPAAPEEPVEETSEDMPSVPAEDGSSEDPNTDDSLNQQ